MLRLAQRLGPANGIHVLTTRFLGPRWGEGIGLHRDKTLLIRREPHNGGFFTCPTLRIEQEVAEYIRRGSDGSRLGTVHDLEPVKNKWWSVRDVDVPPFLANLLERHLDANRGTPGARVRADGAQVPWYQGVSRALTSTQHPLCTRGDWAAWRRCSTVPCTFSG